MKARALFLDRDGVINVDRGYVHRSGQFEFVPGVFALARSWTNELRGPIVVVTNSPAPSAHARASQRDMVRELRHLDRGALPSRKADGNRTLSPLPRIHGKPVRYLIITIPPRQQGLPSAGKSSDPNVWRSGGTAGELQ
jgi:hypothetical protein